ncbi:restriction endonuclease subunit S [Planctomycetota bacterium]
MKTLADLSNEIRYGFTASAATSGTCRFIRITDITDDGRLKKSKVMYVTPDPVSEEKFSLFPGDLLVARSGSIGRPYLVKENMKAVFASYLIRFRLRLDIVDPDYVFYYTQSPMYIQYITNVGRGAAIKNINAKQLGAIQLPVPSLNEQRRIVARIKECIDRVEEIEELQESITPECSIIPTASKYDLWNECSSSFTHIPLDEAVLSAKNGLYKPKKFYGSGKIFLRMFNIKDGELSLERIERVQSTEKETSDFLVRNGNIIVSRVNSRELVGKSAFVQGIDEHAVNEAMIIRLQIDDSKADGRFLAWLMNSPQFLHNLRGRAKHAIGQSSINQSDLLGRKVPLPGIDEQRAIVDAKSQLLPIAFKLQTEMAEQKTIISKLRKAILFKAFSGEL